MGGNLHFLCGKLEIAQNNPSRKVKILKLKSGKSRICISNTHVFCLTIENAYLTTSVNNHFTVPLKAEKKPNNYPGHGPLEFPIMSAIQVRENSILIFQGSICTLK